jgi:hypothetical protein
MVTVYQDFYKNLGDIPLSEMLSRIKEGAYKTQVEAIRQGEGKAELLKKRLPAFTVSATYSGARRKENMTAYNGLYVIDFDHITVESGKLKIENSPFTLAVFVSPSGDGLKVICRPRTRFPLTLENHLQAFKLCADYYELLLGCKADRSGSDPGRLCFVSFDETMRPLDGETMRLLDGETMRPSDNKTIRPLDGEAGLNVSKSHSLKVSASQPGGEVPFIEDEILAMKNEELKMKNEGVAKDTPTDTPTGTPTGTPTSTPTDSDINTRLRYARSSTTNKLKAKYSPGNRNNYVYHFALACVRRGVEEADCLRYADEHFADLPFKERQRTIRSAYTVENGKLKIENEGEAAGTDTGATPNFQFSTFNSKLPLPEVIRRYLEGQGIRTRYNIVISRVEYFQRPGAPSPSERGTGGEASWQLVDEYVENTWWCDLQTLAPKLRLSHKGLSAYLCSAASPRFDPFKNYFLKLPEWDGQTDYIALVAARISTQDDNFFLYCFRKWLCAMVAAAVLSGTKPNHTVLVLRSEKEGLGKTSFAQTLMPPELQQYFFTGLPRLEEKDTFLQLSECLIINLDEMDALTTRDRNRLKELITKPLIRERRSYGHYIENYPRRASFMATTNRLQILSGLEGSRRYLCFDLSRVDYRSPLPHAQLYAQVMSLLRQGFRYWFDEDEIETLNLHNDDFRLRSPLEELLRTWFESPRQEPGESGQQTGGVAAGAVWMTASDVCSKLAYHTHQAVDMRSVSLMGRLLHRQGFPFRKSGGSKLYLLRERSLEEVQAGRRETAEPSGPASAPESPSTEQELPF